MPTLDFHPILVELMQAALDNPSLLQFRKPVTAHQYIKFYQLVTHYLKPGSTVLDWGAGNGHFSYFLIRSGYRVQGFDFDAQPALCEPFSPTTYTYIQADPQHPSNLPYASASFDAVVSVGVLEHVRETGGTELGSLNEIARILKPQGLLLCFHLPNRYSWIEAALRLSRRWSHQYRYTASTIRTLTEQSGFALLELERYAILPRNVWGWGIPGRLGASFELARLYDRIDALFSRIFSPICQNYLFVARKRGA